MSTPSIQTLITQAQQVLNLKSSNEIRATLAAVLANANVGTPLNPNLTTQQLWDEFYEIVRQPSDDIMSIITDQMMRMVFSPPAPGGAGADKQVIFNDGGVLAGDTKFLWDKNANRLDVDGPVVITGAATVATNVLVANATGYTGKVGIGTASPTATLDVVSGGTASTYTVSAVIRDGTYPASGYPTLEFNGFIGGNGYRAGIGSIGGQKLAFYTPSTFAVAPTRKMTLDESGNLLIGTTVAPAYSSKLRVEGGVEIHTSQALNVQPGNANPYEIVNRSAGGFAFYPTGATLGMTLNASGDLRVGTTNDLTGANISSSKGLGTADIVTGRFATVEYGSGAGGAFTTITISVAAPSTVACVIIEALLTGFSGVYLDHVAGRYSTQTPVVIRNNASVGTTAAALAVDGTGLIYTLTITTVVTHPVVKVKATVGGLSGSVALPVITFA